MEGHVGWGQPGSSLCRGDLRAKMSTNEGVSGAKTMWNLLSLGTGQNMQELRVGNRF